MNRSKTGRLLIRWVAAALAFAGSASARAQCTGCANPSFGPAQRWFGSGASANQFAVADFDQDGKLDIAIPVWRGVVIYPGDGGGGFPTSVSAVPDSNRYYDYVATADFNGDGLPDLVASDGGSSDCYLSDGLGGFRLSTSIPTGGRILTADFDGDGVDDLVTSQGFYSSRGDGSFAPPIALPGGPYSWVFAVADYDGDGHPDFVASTGPTATILLSRPGSGFVVAGSFTSTSGLIRDGAAAHFDADTTMDLVLRDDHEFFPPSFAQVLFGDGSGGITPGPSLPIGPGLLGLLAAADFDGDGITDLVAGGQVTFYKGLGGGLFAPGVAYLGGGWSNVVADFNRDGLPDLAIASNAFTVFLGSDSAGLSGLVPQPGVSMAGQIAVGDVTGDGVPDLVVPNDDFGAPGVSVFPGLPGAKLGSPVVYPLSAAATSAALDDFNEDHSLDMVVGSETQILMFMANGSGGFAAPVAHDATIPVASLATGLFDADGHRDVVAGGTGGLVLLLGDGLGGLSAPIPLSDSVEADSLLSADFNGDGKADLAALGPSGLYVFLGHGDGTFEFPIFTGSGSFTASMAVADFNGDGKLDVVTDGYSEVLVYLGNGDGSFAAPVAVPVTAVPTTLVVATADLNGDGKPDLIAAAYEGDVVWALAGDGAGGFGPPSAWLASVTLRIAVGTLDAGGKPDVLTAGPQVGVLRNSNCEPRRLSVARDVATCTGPGQPFSQQPTVGVYDDGGNVIACDTGLITASLVAGSGTPGATLGGTTAVAANAGVAAFTDLSIDLAGSLYGIRFTHPVAAPTGSRPVTVGEPPPAPAASNSGPYCQGQDLNLYATTVPGAVYRWTGPNGFSATVQSPVIHGAAADAAGTYSVIAVVEGCASVAAETTVALRTPQAGPTILGPHQICGTTPLLLRADAAAFAYQWYLNGVPIPGAITASYAVEQVSGVDGGNYTVTASDATGCTTDSGPAFSVALVSCSFLPDGLAVDPPGGSGNGNGIAEPGELAVVSPSWRKTLGGSATPLAGTAVAFTGPAGGTYTIADATADYGTIAPGATSDCASATGDCYEINVSAPGGRPATHWDAFLDETPSGASPTRTWMIHVGGSFNDVPTSHPFYASIEKVLHNRITAGCGLNIYCPSDWITRSQMAVFLLKARHGADYVPPPATGTVFADVPANSFAAAWIEQLANEEITAGCGGGDYCPANPVTRAQMAVFVLRAKYGPGLGPPPCTGIFEDVPCPDGFAVDWIEFLYGQGITGGCNASPLLYCPDSDNTRGQMAVFLDRTFALILYGP